VQAPLAVQAILAYLGRSLSSEALPELDLYGASKRINWRARSDELIKAYDMSLKESK
jgi:hypothetical protein